VLGLLKEDAGVMRLAIQSAWQGIEKGERPFGSVSSTEDRRGPVEESLNWLRLGIEARLGREGKHGLRRA
jgi:hypothetical protein